MPRLLASRIMRRSPAIAFAGIVGSSFWTDCHRSFAPSMISTTAYTPVGTFVLKRVSVPGSVTLSPRAPAFETVGVWVLYRDARSSVRAPG